MVRAMAHRGPDGLSSFTEGTVGLGYAAFVTTPEAHHERQPHRDVARGLAIVLDGRLDDRTPLRRSLVDRGEPPREDTDVELVLRAYAAWGRRCVERMVGDFAFVLWDARRRALFAARDPMQVRPLLYATGRGVVALASEPQGALAAPGIADRPDERTIAELLDGRSSDPARTLHADVRALLPGHALEVTGGRVRTWRASREPTCRPIRHRDVRDYADHLAHLIDVAVRCRLRSDRPVAAWLSGGLDSTTVAAFAQAALGRDRPLATYAMREPGQPWDESRWIDAVRAHVGLAGRDLPPHRAPLADYEAEARRWRSLPSWPNGMMFRHLREAAAADGHRVVLSGQGGDEWLRAVHTPVADALAALRPGALRRALATQVEREGRAPGLRRAAREVAEAFLPPGALGFLRRMRRRPSPWLGRDLVRRAGLGPGALPAGPWWRDRRPSARATIADVREARSLWMFHQMDWMAAAAGIEERHPLHDVRVATFALSVPPDVLRAGGMRKGLLRQAVGDRLPDAVRERTEKAWFDGLLREPLRHPSALERLREGVLVTRGYADRAGLRALLEAVQGHAGNGMTDGGAAVWSAWQAVALEVWLRALDTPGRRV